MGAPLPTLLLTRPHESAEDFAKAAAWPGRVVISPLLRVVLHDLDPPSTDCELIVTSQHAVRALARATSQRDWPMWCVGPGSLAVARAAGFCDLRAGGGCAESLFARLCAAPHAAELVHLRGAHVAADLAERLNAAGRRARAIVCYDQIARPLSGPARACLGAPGTVVVPVFSPRSAMLLAQEWHDLPAPRARLQGVAISEAAANPLNGLPLSRLVIADTPDRVGMLAALAGVQATLEPDQNPR